VLRGWQLAELGASWPVSTALDKLLHSELINRMMPLAALHCLPSSYMKEGPKRSQLMNIVVYDTSFGTIKIELYGKARSRENFSTTWTRSYDGTVFTGHVPIHDSRRGFLWHEPEEDKSHKKRVEQRLSNHRRTLAWPTPIHSRRPFFIHV